MAKILIVDDRPTNRQFLLTLLGYGNHRLFEAANGVQALEMTQMERPDLVISDILMPTMDGYEFVQRLRADPGLAATPVIFQTATYSTPQALALAQSCGVSVVLPKPCEPQLMLDAVSEIVGTDNPLVAPVATTTDRDRAGQQFGAYLHDLESVKLGFEEIVQHDPKLATPEWMREMAGRFAESVVGMQRVASRLSALMEVGMEMVSERDPERLVKLFFGAACDVIDAGYAAIGILDEREQALKYVFTKHIDTGLYRSDELHYGVLGTLLGGCQSVRIHHAAAVPSAEELPAGHPPVSSFLGVPVVCAERVYGWLYFADKPGGEFNAEDERLAVILAARLALLFENATLYDVIQRHAAQLQVEVVERKKAEEEIRRLNQDLEQRVAARTMELQAANREMEAFSYSVSHDLRAPLRHVDAFSAILMEDCADKLDAEGRHYLDNIRTATKSMGQLIDDLLELSRVTRREMRREAVDLSRLADEIGARLQEVQPQRQVELVFAAGLVANGDAGLLRIALENLLDNAWKFTGKRARARIELGCAREDGEMVYFVRDNGAGFDMAYVAKLFGAFQRLHAAAEFEGTGIGLATVQRIVHRHGGRVWAEGKVDAGATFFFTLPILRGGGT